MLKPSECRRCGTRLSGDDSQPLRHQVWELPEIRPLVTEYQRHRRECPCCHETTCGVLPVGVPTALSDLLTDRFQGRVTCDRAKMYWCCGRLQWCWSHLKRDIQALIDSDDAQVRRLGHDLMRPTKVLFRQWHRYRAGEITHAGLKRLLAPQREQINALWLRGQCSGHPRLTGMCQELWNQRDWLWTFLDHEGVEPTNNAAERALRHAVIWRKLSFGTQSAKGSRFVETLLTVIETCRQQSRSVFQFLTTAVEALFANQSAPSLVSGP